MGHIVKSSASSGIDLVIVRWENSYIKTPFGVPKPRAVCLVRGDHAMPRPKKDHVERLSRGHPTRGKIGSRSVWDTG